jgi:hypothetical protein
MLRSNAELLTWREPFRQLVFTAAAEEEDDVLWIGT